jgi:L-malate glycosyltransferase
MNRERPTHVLFLVDVLSGLDFSGGVVKGLAGVEAVLLNVIRLMPQERYRFSMVTFSAGKNLVGADQFPCPLHVFPLKKTYDWNAFKMALKLRSLIRFQNVNIVHTFLETADIWGGLVAKLSGCPILISSRRDMGCFRSTKHTLGYRVVNNLVDQVQAVSDKVRDSCIKNDGLSARKVITVHNGVGLERFNAVNGTADVREKLTIEQNAPLITTIANIRPVKGIDVLIRAAAIVCREFPQAKFLIAGEVIDRKCFDELQTLIRNLQLINNVTFLGRSNDVFSILKRSTLFCLLSRSEGLSNAILEAMATGLPCVVTNVGGNPEVVEDGQNGFLVASEDAETAADRILMLLRHPDHAGQMGQVGRKTIATRFTLEAMVAKWAMLYDQLLTSHGTRPL